MPVAFDFRILKDNLSFLCYYNIYCCFYYDRLKYYIHIDTRNVVNIRYYVTLHSVISNNDHHNLLRYTKLSLFIIFCNYVKYSMNTYVHATYMYIDFWEKIYIIVRKF